MNPPTEAELSKARAAHAEKICKYVREAFSGVTLGHGIGLFEAQAIDNYGTKNQRQQMRDKDEKKLWHRIQIKHLNACHSSLSFFDSLGMRFHLPAFIIAELTCELHENLGFHLTYLNNHTRKKFGLLSPEQRQSLRAYLEFIREAQDSESNYVDIDHALNDYWTEVS